MYRVRRNEKYSPLQSTDNSSMVQDNFIIFCVTVKHLHSNNYNLMLMMMLMLMLMLLLLLLLLLMMMMLATATTTTTIQQLNLRRLKLLIIIAHQHSDADARRDIDTRILCPSVRHVPVLYRNGLIYRHNFFTSR